MAVTPVGVTPVGVSPTPTPNPSPPGAIPGSVWVSGATLNFVDGTGVIRSVTGGAVATQGEAIKGSMWITPGDALLYVDSSNVIRSVARTSGAARPPGSIRGSVWVDSQATAGNTQFKWIGGANVFNWT